MRIRDMTAGSPAKLLLVTALPLMLGNMFQQMYTVADAAVVGRGVGMAALAALGSSDWFNWMWIAIAQGFAQGFSIPVAQAFGAKDYPELRRTVGNATVLSAALAVLIALAAQLSVLPALRLLDTPLEIRPTAIQYLRVLFAGLPIVMAYNLMAGILRAFGDSRSPLMAMVMASLLNIALDVLFVVALPFGVRGAAAATLIAQAFTCVYCFTRLRSLPFMRLNREDFQPEARLERALVKLGLPVSLQNCVVAIGGMLLQRVANPLGVVFIAGYTATNKLYGLLEVAAVSYGFAISTYTGQNIGARAPERVRKGLRAGLWIGAITAVLIGLCMFLFGRNIIGLFIEAGPDAERAKDIACEYLYIMSAGLPILYVLHVVRSMLQGMGDTFNPMLSGVAEFFMRTGSALLLPQRIGHKGIFLAEVLAWAGADIVLVSAYLRAKGKLGTMEMEKA